MKSASILALRQALSRWVRKLQYKLGGILEKIQRFQTTRLPVFGQLSESGIIALRALRSPGPVGRSTSAKLLRASLVSEVSHPVAPERKFQSHPTLPPGRLIVLSCSANRFGHWQLGSSCIYFARTSEKEGIDIFLWQIL